MLSSAVYSFLGFPGWGPVHLVVFQDGSPAGAALLLALATSGAETASPGCLIGSFLKSQRRADPLANPQACRDAEHRYLIVHRPGGQWPLRITAWSRCLESEGWLKLCGPMGLEGFIGRFHPQGCLRP